MITVEHSAHGAAELGVGARGVELDLADRHGRQPQLRGAAEAAEGGVDAVNVEGGPPAGVAGDVWGAGAALLRRGDLGHHLQNGLVVAGGRDMILELLGVHGAAGGDVELVDQRRLAGDHDLVARDLGELQRHVGAAAGADHDLPSADWKPCEIGADRVGAGNDEYEPEAAVGAGDCGLGAAAPR